MNTEAEQHAYAAMQAHLIALLLRHDDSWFRRFYAARTDFDPEVETDDLRRYRELGVIFHLRDELFEHILPRIVRRLSFESPRRLVIEEPPAQGRVDWERTLDATWSERPGETPLLLHTRQRRRDFATPGNLLTVVTLLEFRADVQRLLWDEREAVGAAALRHPLNDIMERCDRELQFPQFAGLRHVAQRIVDGVDGGPDALEMRVGEQVMPGANSAYQELLDWRVRRRTLQLLRRTAAVQADDVLGADPRRDNYLYQIWIFYELADLLQEHERLIMLDTRSGKMRLRFRWGEEGVECNYELRHDQSVPDPVGHWTKATAPGVRPDFYLRRIHPAPERHADNTNTYWREPGVVWDAKYYKERESVHAPSSPVKRMIADLELLGEEDGTLLFAFLTQKSRSDGGEIPAEQQGEGGMDEHLASVERFSDLGEDVFTPDLVVPGTSVSTLVALPAVAPRLAPVTYTLAPEHGFDHTMIPDRRVTVLQLRPESEVATSSVRTILMERLELAHSRMKQVREPRCHGVFLDSLSAVGQQPFFDRYGTPITGDSAELVLCPKPHIGRWRIDLVSRQQHCCQDGRICQIIGRADRKKPVRPPRTAQELIQELQNIFTDARPGEIDEEHVAAIAQQVESMTRRYAEIAGIAPRLYLYFNRLRDLGMNRTLDELGEEERESLALALFLVEQLDQVGVEDYSAPAIHLSSVMELEVQRRIYSCPMLVGALANPRKQTLGSLPFIQWKPWESEGNWERIVDYAREHWNGAVDPDDSERVISFEVFVKAMKHIADLRNLAAHPHAFSRNDYSTLQRILCQGGPLGIGALNVLLLAWQEHKPG